MKIYWKSDFFAWGNSDAQFSSAGCDHYNTMAIQRETIGMRFKSFWRMSSLFRGIRDSLFGNRAILQIVPGLQSGGITIETGLFHQIRR
jgi:hypothetical protein